MWSTIVLYRIIKWKCISLKKISPHEITWYDIRSGSFCLTTISSLTQTKLYMLFNDAILYIHNDYNWGEINVPEIRILIICIALISAKLFCQTRGGNNASGKDAVLTNLQRLYSADGGCQSTSEPRVWCWQCTESLSLINTSDRWTFVARQLRPLISFDVSLFWEQEMVPCRNKF